MMPRLLLVLLVLCGAAVPLAAQAARIDSLLGASAWREAVVVLDAVIAERPSAADFARRGRAHRELNELAKSRADYDAAIRADSTFGPATPAVRRPGFGCPTAKVPSRTWPERETSR
jgi:hypothetical protein